MEKFITYGAFMLYGIVMVKNVVTQGVFAKMSRKGPKTAVKRLKMIKIGPFSPNMTRNHMFLTQKRPKNTFFTHKML